MFLAISAACSMAVQAVRSGVWGAARPPNGVIPILGLVVDGVFYLMPFPHMLVYGRQFVMACASAVAQGMERRGDEVRIVLIDSV